MTMLEGPRPQPEQPANRWAGLSMSQAATLEVHWRIYCQAHRSDKVKLLAMQMQSNTQAEAIFKGPDFDEAIRRAVAMTEDAEWELRSRIAQASFNTMSDAELNLLMQQEMLRGSELRSATANRLKGDFQP